MLTKGAIGNLVNRYKAVLAKCNLMNTFGSLAVASMLVLGGAGVAGAEDLGHFTEADNGKTIVAETHLGNALGRWDKRDITIDGNTEITIKSVGMSFGNVTGEDATINFVCDRVYGISTGILIDGNMNSATNYATGPMTVKVKKMTVINELAHDSQYGIWAQNKDASGVNLSVDAEIVEVNAINHAISLHTGAVAEFKNVQEFKATASEKNALRVVGGSVLTITGADGAKIIATGGSNGDGINVYDDKSAISITNENGTNEISSVLNKGKLTINGGKTNIKGAFSGDNGTFEANNAKLYLHGENSLGTVKGSGSSIVLDVDTTSVNIGANETNDLTYKTTAALNDAKTPEQVKEILDGDVDNVSFAGADEGFVAPELDGNGNPTGPNSIMDAALKQASVATVALDKILTNDVRKRLGDIRSDKNQTGVWMRWDGGKLKGDSGLTNNFNTIQIGGDTKVGTNCRIGVAGSFTHGDTDFARGNGELEGFSFALYSTWMGENGMFADIVTRLGHFSNEMNVEGRKGDMDNRVFSLSGEYGWRFDLCKQFFLEPQVELAYTYVSSDDLQLGTAHYAFDNVNSLVGRAGLVAGWNLPDDMGSVYARASVLQQFMGDAKISGTNGNAYNVQELDGDDTWLEYGIGANVKLTEKTYIWADVERTAGADLDEEWRGTVGVRFSF